MEYVVPTFGRVRIYVDHVRTYVIVNLAKSLTKCILLVIG